MGNGSSSVSVQSNGSGSTRSSKKFERPLPPSESKNAQLVLDRWCKAMSRHDMRTVKRFASPGSMFMYKGADAGMSLLDFFDEIANLFRSFPDTTFSWDSVEEIEPGKVKVKNFTGGGTHTGEPFGFGPFPRVPATGIRVNEIPCDIFVKIEGGKMTRFVADANGEIVAPPSFYLKIGGDLGM